MGQRGLPPYLDGVARITYNFVSQITLVGWLPCDVERRLFIDTEKKTLLKEFIIDNRLDNLAAKANRANALFGDTSKQEAFIEEYGFTCFVVANRFNHSQWKKKQRMQRKVGDAILSGNALFLTFSFTDDCLARTSTATRRTYVSRYLKKHCEMYVANIDFGNNGDKRSYTDDYGELRESTAREHYHAVCVPKGKLPLRDWCKLGTINLRHVRKSNHSLQATLRYVAKVTAHAFKIKGKTPRLIYSRNTID